METPSSTRRVTRSQTLAAINNSNSTLRKLGECEKELTETRQRTMKQQDRSALFDITNDSPIVGLAMGVLETPSSAMSKKKVINRGKNNKQETTPGSGEALLRGQVKTLLQKVEEEAELSKLSSEHGPFLPLKGLVNSPMGLIIAPTPANTPQVLPLSAQSKELGSPAESPVEEKFLIPQMISDMIEGKKQENVEGDSECDKNLIVTRSLLMDFSEKSEESFSSVVTYQGTESEDNKEKTNGEDDDASIWSIQVNASTTDEQEEEEEGIEEEDCNDEFYCYNYNDGEEEEEEGESDLINELCEGISKITVEEPTRKMMPKFTGKHTRFCYNSDDEIDGVEEVVNGDEIEPGALHLKGLPTPGGKHIRFPEEEEEQMDSSN